MTDRTVVLEFINGNLTLDCIVDEYETVMRYWTPENVAFRTFFNERRPDITEPVYVRLDPREPHPSCKTLHTGESQDAKTIDCHILAFGEFREDGGHTLAHELTHALLNRRPDKLTVVRRGVMYDKQPLASALSSFVEDRHVEALLKPYGFTPDLMRFEWVKFLPLFGLTPSQSRSKLVVLNLALFASHGHWIDEFHAGDSLPPDPMLAQFPDVQKAVKRINKDAARYDLSTSSGARAFFTTTLSYYGFLDRFMVI